MAGKEDTIDRDVERVEHASGTFKLNKHVYTACVVRYTENTFNNCVRSNTQNSRARRPRDRRPRKSWTCSRAPAGNLHVPEQPKSC
eukprot:7448176-Pyramimonas_sp.AAC.1